MLVTSNLEQWFLNFPNLGTPIHEDIGLGIICVKPCHEVKRVDVAVCAAGGRSKHLAFFLGTANFLLTTLKNLKPWLKF